MKRAHFLVAFFGIDGSGKTTLIKKVKQRLEKEGREVEIFYMGLGSSHYFRPLKWIMNLRAKRNREKRGTDEMVLKDYNFRQRSFFWVLGQYCELWLRYFHALWLSRKKVILFDRYFYDGLVLGNTFTFTILKHITPKPHISFLIKAPAKIIRSRKDEAEVTHIHAYYKNAEKLSPYFDIIEIDNSRNIDIVVEELMKHIHA